jgi:hypothetical protein
LRHPASRRDALSNKSTRQTGQHSERHEVESVVFEDRFQAANIAAAEESDISRRDLGSGHIPNAMQAEYVSLETDETTFVSLPEPPTGVEQVDMSQRPEGRGLAVKGKPCVGDRSVKRTAIEGNNGMSLREHLGNRAEHRRLVREVTQEVLTGVKRATLEPTQSDKKGNGPSSPVQASGLEVEADDRPWRTSDRRLIRELQSVSGRTLSRKEGKRASSETGIRAEVLPTIAMAFIIGAPDDGARTGWSHLNRTTEDVGGLRSDSLRRRRGPFLRRRPERSSPTVDDLPQAIKPTQPSISIAHDSGHTLRPPGHR